MSTTHESSAADTAERARRMAPPLLGRTNALLDELEWSRVEIQRLQAMVPNPDKARSDRTQDIEDLVLAALDNATLHTDVMEAHPRFRTTKVIDHLREFKLRYQITKPPCRYKVSEILKKFGYM